MKRSIKIVAGLAVLGLAVPVINLIQGGPSKTKLTQSPPADPQAQKVAAVLEAKCGHCHVPDASKPFYAGMPVAGSMVAKDVAQGLSWMDLTGALFPAGKAASEPTLAKLEWVAEQGSMPPGRYVAMHWNARLSGEEKATLASWIKETRAKQYGAGLPTALAANPIHPIPAKLDVDPRKVELGRQLYHDKRLSGDDTVSCATCHDLNKGGTDQAQYSTGIRGQLGGINAPTTFNAAFQVLQFWDGRAPTLEAQAGGPPNNPVEMGSNWPQITGKLAADAAFAQDFKAVYAAGFTADTITDAIAAFERTLLTPNSKFDKLLAGDQQALNAEEQRGHARFKELGCATCHVGKLLGGQSFERMGRRGPYFADRGKETDADFGRFNFTKAEKDKYHLKVPTLRNVARTAPYLHDGSAKDLASAVRVMARYQQGQILAEADVQAIVKFLETLTGEYQGKLL